MSHPSAAPDPAPGSGGPKLLTRLRSAVRARHYSARTEESYVGWVKRFVRFHDKRHPATLGETEVQEFVVYLAERAQVSASTQNQAVAALLFLYEVVLGRPLRLSPTECPCQGAPPGAGRV